MGAIGIVAVGILLLASCNYRQRAEDHRANDPDTRPWWCHSTGDSHGHGSEPYRYMGLEKGMLSWEDCFTVSSNFDAALSYAVTYPTAGDAEDAGFTQMVPYFPGMGTHHAQLGSFDPRSPEFDPKNPRFPGTALDEHFDPNRPEFLQYAGNGRDAKLVGMSWYVRTDNGLPPGGFAGVNDWWHVHERLCFTPDYGFKGQNLSDQECQNRGGENWYLDDYYMVHAWIVPGWEHQPDVFIGHHPCLAGSPITDPHHPCRQATSHH